MNSITATWDTINKISNAKRKKENFPVASWFIAPRARRAMLALYQFARHADDIADNGGVKGATRKAKLERIYTALEQQDEAALPSWAKDYVACVKDGAMSVRHGKALLRAFMQDCEQSSYTGWEDLIDYCMMSASPVGRAVLEIHEQWLADIAASDALCNALQILNHLQDLRTDYHELNRVYMPKHWLPDASLLDAERSSYTVRKAIDQALSNTRMLLKRAQALPPTLSGFRVRAEVCTILNIARMLAITLRKQDPLAKRVKLSRMQYARCVIKGLVMSMRIHVSRYSSKALIRASKTSFFWPLMRLRQRKRDAMLAVYAFCRVTDDAVDEVADNHEAKANITQWRRELTALYSDDPMQYPAHPATRALMPHIARYDLQQQYFDGILNGLEMDADGQMVKPSRKQFEDYTYNVASCVGLLSVHIFGYTHPSTKEYAVELGKAFQIINIMRDVTEDAARNRIYIPRPLLDKAGLGEITPASLEHYAEELKPCIAAIAKEARKHLNAAHKALQPQDRKAMATASAMERIYLNYLGQLEAQGWDIAAPRPSLTHVEKLRLMLLAR